MALDAEDFTNVEADIEFIGKIANAAPDVANPGHPNGTATNRLGVTAKVATKMIEEAEEAMTLNAFASLFPNGHAAALDRILTYRIIGGDPTKFYYIRDFFYKDGGTTRFALRLNEADDASDTGETNVADYFLDPANFTGLQLITAPPVGDSGITLVAVVDFGDGATPWGVYNSGTSYANAALSRGSIAIADNASTNALIETGLAEEALLSGETFRPTVRSKTLRGVLKNAWVYGAVEGHEYGVRRLEGSLGGGTPYARIYFRDFTADADKAYVYIIAPSPMDWPTFQAYLNETYPEAIGGDEVFGYNGLRVHTEINWSAFPTGVTDYTLTTGGIRNERVYPDRRVANYLQDDRYDERIPVAIGDFRDVVESLQRQGQTSISARAHYAHRIRLFLYEDGEYNATYLEIPDYVELEGMGRSRTFIRRENNTAHAVVEAHFDHKVFDLTIVSETHPNYPLHSDGVNKYIGGDNSGPLAQVMRSRQKYTRVDLVLASGNQGQGFGSGVSSGTVIHFEDCGAWHEDAPQAINSDDGGIVNSGFFFHNTGPTNSNPGLSHSYLPGEVRMRGCVVKDDHTESVYIMTLEPAAECRLSIQDCDFAFVRHEVAGGGEVRTDLVKDRVQWVISGHHEGPFLFNDNDGAKVLATSIGAVVTGNAASLIFGDVDELGRGEKYIGGGNYTLGKRLGDCSSVNKTLTIDGVSKVFNTNLTNETNATIIGLINAAIPADPVSEVDVKLEWYPDCGFKRRMKNTSGVTIPKGRFVKCTGRGEIALAQPGDRIYGWTFRAILNNYVGDIAISRKIWYAMIEGAIAEDGVGEGPFGIAANGMFDTAAATKVGDCIGGTITLW